MTFPNYWNLCIDCEAYKHDILLDTIEGSIMGRKRDWLKAARGSGHYPLSFNFVTQQDTKFVQCSYCGKPIPVKQVTRDHVYPKSKGGIIKTPSCLNCNTIKEDMLPIEFAIWFSKEHGIAMLPIGSEYDYT